MPQYLGLDVHKTYLHGYLFRPGQKGVHFRVPNTPAGWDRLVETYVTPETWVALEATGNAFAVYDRLVERAGSVAVAHPVALKRLGAGRHTDRVDAERLAQMLALGTLPRVWVPPAEVRAVRALIQHVRACQEAATQWTNRAKSVLLRAGWSLPRGTAVGPWLAAHGCELDVETQLVVTSALTLAEHAAAEATRLRAEIVRRVLDQPALAWLWSLDGIGPWTAVVIWAWIGDPHRFRHARQVTRYAGWDPSVHQSGEADWRGRISRQGPAVLRHALLEAAWQAIRRVDGPWRAFYDRVVGRLGSRRALVAVARKLLVAAWRIWRDARWAHEMDPGRYHTKVQRIRRTIAQQPPYPLRDRLAQWGVQPVIPPAAAEA